MSRVATLSTRYGKPVWATVWVVFMLLLSMPIAAQGLLQPPDDFLRNLKEQLSPENVLHYRETHPRKPLSRQPPPGQNSWNVELVGMTGGAVYDVAVQGGYAYCANGAGLVALDVSTPASPQWVAGLMLLEGGWRVTAAPPYVYLGSISGGFYVIDVSTPQQPKVAGYCDTGNPDRRIQKIAVSGSYAYLASLSRALQVLDISDKRNPRLVASLSFPDYVYDVFISGSVAYVAAGGAGLQVVDVSNPLNPQKMGEYTPDITGFSARAVSVTGTVAYLAGVNGVVVLDVSNPQQPQKIASASVPGTGRHVRISGARVYVANGAKGIRIIDASDPNNIKEVASFAEEQNDAWSTFPLNNYAYVANGYLGLLVLDVSSPASPRIAGRYYMPGSAWGIAVSGSRVCVGGLVAGMQVVDATDPTHPREVGRRRLADWVLNLSTSGHYAYAASWEHGLQVLDISNPFNPREIGSADTPGFSVGVAVVGNRAYVADGYAGLQIFDISNPAFPVKLGSIDTPNQAFDVFVSGSFAYVADVQGGLRIIDVSNPSRPTETGFYNHHAKGIYVSGSYAYVAGGEGGLRIVDVSDPAHPREVGFYSTTGDVWSVAVVGTLAYITEETGGLSVIDVSDPFNPVLVGYHDTPSLALRVATDGNYVYLANYDSGVFIFRYTGSVSNHPPRVPTLLAPNEDETVSTATPAFKVKTDDIDGDRVKFEIQVAKGNDVRTFATDFVASGEEAVYTVPAEQALIAGQWSWKARAVDDKGAVSNWSAARTLTVNVNTPPTVPTLIAPASGATVSATPSLTLSASDPDGERVKLEIQVTGGTEMRTFTIDYVDSGTEATYTVPADQPLSDGQWSWRAKAIDERGAESGWSEAWNFTVAVNRAPATPTLIAPAPGAVVTPTPTFRLKTDDPGGDRVKFVIRLNKDAEARTVITGFVNSGADAAYTVPSAQPLSQGLWSWRAKAIDEQGAESGWSAPQEFTVRVDKPDLVPSEVTVSSPKAMTGGVVTVSVRVTNRGDAPASSSGARVQLSRSATAPSTSDRVLTEFLTPTLGVNQSITHESQVIIPTDVQPGDYTVWVIVDANGALDQSDRSNDQSKVTLRVVPSAQVWLPAGVNTLGVSTSSEELAPGKIGLSGMAMKRWEPDSGYMDVGEAQPLQAGKAYWVRVPRSMAIRVPAETSAEPAVIRLQRGWNLIACPYPSSVRWSLDLLRVRMGALTVNLEQAQQSGWMESYAWGWKQSTQNPYAGHYVLVYDADVVPGVQGALEPWKGYWVYAHQQCDMLLPSDASGETRSTSRLSTTGRGWALPVLARRGDSEAEAIIGVSTNGRGLSVPPPPAPPATAENQPVEVLIERVGVPLAVDVRGSAGVRQEWNLLVRFGAGHGEVSLHWNGASRLPRDVSLTLIDQTTGARRHLRTTPDYRFTPAQGETQRRFTLIAERNTGLPLRIVGLRASQTRGKTTAIQFSLSRTAAIQAEVLDASGRRVAVLDAGGTRQAGQHTLVWRGVDSEGRALPAGAYFVRVQAQDEEGRRTQAMVPLVLVR